MIFAQSYYAWVLLIVAGLILFFVWAGRQRRKNIDLFISRGLSADMAGMVNRKQQVIKIALIIFACLFLSFALMRPQWGFKWQEVKRQGLDILIALDTSKSMLASDIKPNRLERSKLAIKDLIQKLSGDQVGLIAFAGSAYLQCPLTVDYEGFLLALANLDTDTIGIPGTSLAAAIEEALKVFKGGDKKYQA